MKTEGGSQSRSRRKSIPFAKGANGKGDHGPDLSSERREIGSEAVAEPGYVPSREEKIAIVAYYKAQRRGFASSGELDDWLEAEREVDRNGGESGVDKTHPQT